MFLNQKSQTRAVLRPKIAPTPSRTISGLSGMNLRIRELIHLPRPAYGQINDADSEIGYWARRAKACQWSVAIKHLADDNSLLSRLIAVLLKREVVLQSQIKNRRR